MKRNISRVKAMIKLYQNDLLKTGDNLDTFDLLLEEVEKEDLSNYLASNDSDSDELDNDNLTNEYEYDKLFSDKIYIGVLENQNKIDHTIARYLDNYPLDRVSYVDRALLRIGTYELMFTNTPTPIIINEIVNLSKEYSEIDKFYTSKFNNGVLDKIAKGIRK